MKAIFLSKLRIVNAVLLVAVSIVAAVATLATLPVLAAEQPQSPKADKPAQDSGEGQSLARARADEILWASDPVFNQTFALVVTGVINE